MLTSTPPKDLFSSRPRDSSLSPSCRQRHFTPPRLPSAPNYESPMLTPSPLRQRTSFSNNPYGDLNSSDGNDLFSIQSPFKVSAPAHFLTSNMPSRPQPIVPDDDEGSIFLSSKSTPSISPFSPFFPTSTSQPLRTPLKPIHQLSNRAVPLSNVKRMSALASTPAAPSGPSTRVGVGTKRKSTPHLTATPIRPHDLKPLNISCAKTDSGAPQTPLERLGPLAPPKFPPRTPQSKAETEAYLRRGTATLTRLSIADMSSAEEEDFNDSGCEIDDDGIEALNWSKKKVEGGDTRVNQLKAAEFFLGGKGKKDEEVAEAVSPGGHIIKRRAKRRPLSAELLESALKSPSPSKSSGPKLVPQVRISEIAFPSAPLPRKRTPSASSESESEAIPHRRRVRNKSLQPPPSILRPTAPRMPNRNDNLSAATLFFGPSIKKAEGASSELRSRIPTLSSSTPNPGLSKSRSRSITRHSYAGPEKRQNTPAWNQPRKTPSPCSSPPIAEFPHRTDTDDEDMFGISGPPDSSFVFSVTGTPSPRVKRPDPQILPKKYKPRDSGVVVTSDEDGDDLMLGIHSTAESSAPSSSTNSVFGDTPTGTPSHRFNVFVTGADVNESAAGSDVDAFIMRILAASSKASGEQRKRVPGTPVKRNKVQYLAGGARPWQSAVATRVGPRFDFDVKDKRGARKSLPGPTFGVAFDDSDTDSGDDEDSPARRRESYGGLGLGRPVKGKTAKNRTNWLMRRSSSGAFESGNESGSSAGTPTRNKKEPHTPGPLHLSSTKNGFMRTASNSSSSSAATLGSPSIRRPAAQQPHHLKNFRVHQTDEKGGRFQRDFEVDEELGCGEFGTVFKVRDHLDCVYAIKKSKRFEGARHRRRVREEVDTLQHLSHLAAGAHFEDDRHPNVLAFIDTWEEDDTLFIQTELCESGNLAQFLWEFGRAYPRLDEGRVWKIVAELSQGLQFIHDADIIHLDLKPSNVFLTSDGRFKIGDFGMASMWPRPLSDDGGFEREGDKLYLAPEVLQGQYGKAADIFSLGMTILETASNIVVPDQGEAWHRLRREDFSQVDLDESPELLELIRQMMRTEPCLRMSVHAVCNHPAVSRARAMMESLRDVAKREETSLFAASPLGRTHAGFLDEILGRKSMDLSA